MPDDAVIAAFEIHLEQREENLQRTGAGLLKRLSDLEDRAVMLWLPCSARAHQRASRL
jgi:hypothetical protein